MFNTKVIIVFLLCLVCKVAYSQEVVAVVNSKNGISTISKDELKAAFTGKLKKWEKDGMVQIILQKTGGEATNLLATKVFGVPEDALRTKIKQEVFKGEMKKPVEVSTDLECMQAVAKNEGGICVVSVETANTLPTGVQKVKISGV